MNAAILLKAGLSTSVLLFFALITFSQATYAWRLEPEVIKEPEGTTVQLQVFIETSDWVLADDAAINTCAGLGYAASKVARYRLKRKDGTARWTSNPNVKDLHLISSGQPTLDPTVLYCGAGHYPTLTIDDSHAINLHNDDEDEGSEQAKLELWSIDEEGDETYITSS
ncbi:MAG TPA: hypothetical protein VKN35_15685, partial [Xanthomonadales bacterium]|nr:hypothetical protein [Xanthomonadales bacterium]